ncbi:PREDICTED: SCO-spondin [Condylura cristata]|uniref:SCO-spondin n=1 Tax=Condylura cristata TaxID=143302 RepID=UPI000643B278|nr:PREDICTED: SCO-spondin [Condylura cristata]
MLLPALLLGLGCLAHGRWCERTETVLVEEEVSPRREDLVPCASLYHYRRQGWRLAPARSAPAGLCPIYKPPETRPAARNQTAWACCPGWGGTDCALALADASPQGHCFATWQCQPGAGPTEAPAGSLQDCCARPWARSWRDGHSGLCLRCARQRGPGDAPSPAPLRPLAGAVAHLWSQHQRPSATCAAWSGFHYRTFDGHHFRFLGRCSYLLAGAADSSWAVHLTPRGHCPRPGHCQLARVMMGPEEVLIQGGAVSVNGQLVREGESRLLPGLSLQWQGDWLVLSGGLGVVVRLDRSTSVSVSVDSELQGQTQGLCGLYNGRPEDDFLEPGGGLAELAAAFGDSWRLPDSEPGCLEAVEAAQSCEEPPRVTEAELEAGGLQTEAQDVCRPLLHGPFRECHAQVPPAAYHEACLFAYCAGASASGGPEARRDSVCATLTHYALACAQRHTPVRWRKPGFCGGVCREGRWLCAQAPCPAECALGGDGHYLTFDGRSFSFRGRAGCRYSLVQDPSQGQLLVALEHGACDSGSCLRAVSVSLGDTHILLRDSGAVLVGGQAVGLPWNGAGGLSVVRASSSFLLLRWPGAQLLWGVADPAAYITLDPRYAHQVQGLCGTFTWNQQDDFLTPAGDVETSVAAFASKFQAAGDGGCSSEEDTTPLPPCGTHTQGHVFAEAACAILQGSAFQACHGLVDREPFRLRCLAAACGCAPGGACLCPVLAAYARRCAQEGALLSWRNQTLCAVPCPAGQEYQECAPACGRHCGEPEDCGALAGCVAGCGCPAGLLWDPEGRCVPPSLCPCQVGAHRYAPGSATRRDCNDCVCQERGLWSCTARRCTPPRARCPGELVHVPGACLLTCDSPGANLSCPLGSPGGCVCPPGTVLLGERCVPPELCPCRHGGQWYPPNATVQEDCSVCVCQGGRWRCTGRPCGGRCQASGAPHYVTFDGLAFTFPGACEYLLVGEAGGRFTVSAQNLPCGAAGLTCTKALTVRLQGTAVRMLRGRGVTVNGVSVTPPKVYTGPGLSLRRAGLFLLLSTRLGLSLLWDGGTRVLVQLPPQFRGRVAGLCGDFDGDAGNDPRSRQGGLEPSSAPALPLPVRRPRPPPACLSRAPPGGVAKSGGLFPCGSAPQLCLSPERLCDGAPDCAQGEDERDCAGPAAPGAPHSAGPCQEYSCPGGRCIGFQLVCDGQPDCGSAGEAASSPEEQGCGAWDCRLCVCQDGRPQRCRPNPDCAVDCGWSSWSRWAECLGPCGSQSVQWSFRSPNNPGVSGRGRQCPGLRRKARRCQTEPCGRCELLGQVHSVGARWRGGPCSVCQCLHNGTVHCSPYCPLGGCPQDWVLVEPPGEACCRCVPPGEKLTVRPTVTAAPTPAPSAGIGARLITYALPPPGDPCYSPLGLARLSEGGLQLEHPASAALLGAPSRGPDSHAPQRPGVPYQQLDLRQPQNLTGQWLSPGDWGDVTLTAWTFGQMVQARYVRVWPQDAHRSPPLRVELLGCQPAVLPCPGTGHRCASGQCAPGGAPCDGVGDCEDSDGQGCAPPAAGARRVPSTAGAPGPSSGPGQLPPRPREGLAEAGHRRLGEGSPTAPTGKGPVSPDLGSEAPRPSPGGSAQTPAAASASQPEAPGPGVAAVTAPRPRPMSPVGPAGQSGAPGPLRCSPGQVPCQALACVGQEQLCDGTEDCPDGSDEGHCGERGRGPGRVRGRVSGGAKETQLRPALPGGGCPSDRLHRQPCFVQACPVAGVWAVWEAWGPCSVSCGGGHRSRRRSCVDPPPKNGGAPCPGASQEGAPCSLQPCAGDAGCGPGLVHVGADLCRKGLVPPCPPSCLDPTANRSCSGHCLEGCRCPPGLLLHGAGCLPLSECPCLVGGELKPPGVPFLLDNCSQCLCEEGELLCEPRACAVPCGWSAWSSWGPCDRSCGPGLRARFRSPSNPPAAFGGAPCEGDRQELQACHRECGTEAQGWTPWTPWSACSRSCLPPGGDPGLRSRSRLCPGPGGASCPGEATQEEPCGPAVCSAPSAWGPWAAWSACSAPCDGGVQTRGRSCSGSAPGDPECQGPHSQTRDCNTQACTAQCPEGMVPRSEEQCRQEGGPCPRLCLAQGPGVECVGSCAPGCACPPGLFLHNASCLPRHQCPCQLRGRLHAPGAVAQLDACNNCTCVSGEMVCTSEPCPVACGWSPWTPWSPCSRSCNVGVRRRFRAGTAPPAAFGGAACQGPNMEAEFCSLQLCQGPGGQWGPWSPCSVPCGGGFRNRSRGGLPGQLDFSACGLQPCAGPAPGVCPGDKRWLDCAQSPASCAELSAPQGTNTTCRPGCYCLPGTLLLNNVCVPTQDCPCAHGGRLYPPGGTVLRPCENCWGFWALLETPLFQRLLHKPLAVAEEEPCLLPGCDRAGGWGPWGPWSSCSRSCGGGLRSRARACDRPPPRGLGDYCEGPGAQGEACQAPPCPVANCSAIQGAEYSPCGPPCPRSCDDLAHCVWRCQPGCYCPPGQVLSADGAVCVRPAHCDCLDLLTGAWHRPGAQLARPDGCNHCTCLEGKLTCTDLPCPVPGGWCPWSEWTACSQPCRGQTRTRSRACACPAPRQGGAPCPGGAGEAGPQHQREVCPGAQCPVDGAWGAWGPWSPCDACGGQSHRSRACSWPPASEGGVPCPGGHRQSRPCQDNATRCADCGGGQGLLPCGRPCPRSCQDLSPGTMCQPGPPGCQPSCGCPAGQLSQDGLCVPPARCRCQHQPGAMGVPENQSRSVGSELSSWESLEPGEVVAGPCMRCRRRQCGRPTPAPGGRGCPGPLQDVEYCLSPDCPGAAGSTVEPVTGRPGGWGPWSPWSPCSHSCTDPARPALRGRTRLCPGNCTRGDTSQQRPCNLPSCTAEDCVWSGWSSWTPCSCRVRVQQRYRHQGPAAGEGPPCTRLDGHFRPCAAGNCSADSCTPPFEFRACGSPCCGLPSPNASWVLAPAEAVRLDCKSCTCVNGSLECSSRACPLLGPWSSWSKCSAACGGGITERRRSCERGPGGALCQAWDTEQQRQCNLQPCPECPPGQELTACPTACPHLCAHLLPGALCLQVPCQSGCGCPGGQLLHNGTCVPPTACPCTQRSLPWGLTLTPEEQARELPPGAELAQNCTRCTCRGGTFSCSRDEDCWEERPDACHPVTELRNLTKGLCYLDRVEVTYCSGYCPSSTHVMPEEPYLQSQCQCCSYRLDPESPVRVLSLRCPDGRAEPVVLPLIQSCQCSACQGGDFSKR